MKTIFRRAFSDLHSHRNRLCGTQRLGVISRVEAHPEDGNTNAHIHNKQSDHLRHSSYVRLCACVCVFCFCCCGVHSCGRSIASAAAAFAVAGTFPLCMCWCCERRRQHRHQRQRRRQRLWQQQPRQRLCRDVHPRSLVAVCEALCLF